MPVLLLEKDPFVESIETGSTDLAFGGGNVRRPLEGLARKEDRYAFLSLYTTDGAQGLKHISLVDSSAEKSPEGDGYSAANHNFIVNSLSHSKQDKVQIMETFGPFYAFFYGDKPETLQVQGLLLNTIDFNWKNEWIRNYDRYLRGTKCVEYRARVYLGFDDVLVQGFILNTTLQYNAEMPFICPFGFTMLLTGYKDLSEGSDAYVRSSSEVRQTADENYWPEYMEAPAGSAYRVVDPSTGAVSEISGAQEGSTGAAEGKRTAAWVGDGSTGKLWKSPSMAITHIDTEMAVQQSGGDQVTARRQMRADPGSFPLASRSSISASLDKALSSGVANLGCKVGDSPRVT